MQARFRYEVQNRPFDCHSRHLKNDNGVFVVYRGSSFICCCALPARGVVVSAAASVLYYVSRAVIFNRCSAEN